MDFTPADDTLFLNRAIFSTLSSGPFQADAFHEGTAAEDQEDRIIYNQSTGEILYDFSGSSSGGGVLFAIVTPGTALTHEDFVPYI